MSQIIFKKYGSGKKVLVCFPGWIHPIEKEKNFLDKLAKKYTVISVQLPGYVDSPDSKKFIDFPYLAKEINEKIKQFKTKEVVLVGFSLGCRLIMQMEKNFPSKYKKIFVGCPVGEYKIPFWAKLLISNDFFINIARKSNSLMQFSVIKALISIRKNNNVRVFKSNRVSLSGAFDSLVGLLRSKTNLNLYKDTALFIYGDADTYTELAKKINIKHKKIIRNVGHNCVRGNEEEVVGLINDFISF